MTSNPTLPNYARIVEVGPRDGLQNEKQAIGIDTRINLVNMLAEAGLSYIETGSFVSPKWVPQMANTDQVFAGIHRQPNAAYIALVPNMQGFEQAVTAKADEVAIFTTASETFAKKNTNCTIAESIERFKPIIERAKALNIPVRGYISCIAACPYEGLIAPIEVAKLAAQLISMGCYEVSLGDTIGSATPEQISEILECVLPYVPADKLAVHFHDTNGRAIENIHVALQYGISVIDSAIGGLGGCPYAEGATGNVATESVVDLLDKLNIRHDINWEKLNKASQYIRQALTNSAP
ncbi:3-hydroxy-3-isohexenylglutaryl-CoA/hydroxy-methylglutaryl-CoA lyase [Zhongshania aliphaticivorans]|uniref:3-hydroxy-3-isohexenylglutaryl-CoA/hydroxy-methylglutaryl-CoA lyase n=1 Tax=Zhongshania aliphaticivorans TaxID=1470434 RepID=A0A5S9NTD0_9GAMM|nr:hydroxymethylglutaryl-CoA lyase [Zhongshania aliphaticivorans]CAA0093848.1 3-hydroxy-3-isohexenylglutaryl-CoA/hydroxy-methylglutaryl-CoA lyase [Zhongshania aliphaticivorans]CAA0111916.1 3-hydroxy-3-isohexenylglutaryl-CoA/hydroxy-methylglutaryl-CoA lyase [Zhongshania aliphaticivorans]